MIAEPVLALAHTGGIGVIVGLVIGAIAYIAVEENRVWGEETSSPKLASVRWTAAAGSK